MGTTGCAAAVYQSSPRILARSHLGGCRVSGTGLRLIHARMGLPCAAVARLRRAARPDAGLSLSEKVPASAELLHRHQALAVEMPAAHREPVAPDPGIP